jgi:hypothetical protein
MDMGNIRNKLRQAVATRYAAMVGGVVFRLQHVRSRDLLEVGFASLEGDRALAELKKTMAAERKAARLDEAGQERLREIKNAQAAAWMERMAAKPDSSVALEQRLEAYVCAAVTGAGQLRPEALSQLDLGPERPVVPLGSDFDPEAWCVPDDDGSHIADLRYVPEREQDDGDLHLWVESLPPLHRGALGAYVMTQSQGVGDALRPFRLSSGNAHEASPTG